MTASERTIIIAGGGTGGHVFPGLAVAQALRELADVKVVFIGSPRGIESRVIPQHGYELELLDVEPMKGGGASRAIRGALVAAKATRHASGIVGRLRPAAVLSVGGYAAGPGALACVRQRVPLAVLEPNSVLGLANKLLVPFAKRAYVAWAETVRSPKTRTYGVPLRPGFKPRSYLPKPGVRRVLVLGGSQGAEALNERVPRALARVLGKGFELHVTHQTGKDREEATRAEYEKAGVENATVLSFIDDVAAQIASADVVVARSGASTVAEISAIGRASILVPFPHAADDHQAKNALALEALGGTICVRQEAADEARLATELSKLLEDESAAVRMADAARAHGRPEAAEDIAHDLLGLAGIPVKRKKDPVKTNGAAGGANGYHVTSKEVS